MSRHSDTAQMWNAQRERRRKAREELGVPCTSCRIREPKRHPTILLPGQRCYCGYVDKRSADPKVTP